MYRRFLFTAAFVLAAVMASVAQDAKLMIQVDPEQAYVFLDGKPLGDGDRVIRLLPGKHTVAAYNYGYMARSSDISVQAGKTTKVKFTLKRVPGKIMAERGRIQVEGASRAAVFLNGKTPGYFVGHGDEFNNNLFSWQQLIVPPGTYQMTVVDKDKEIWSGPVTVVANRRVIVDVAHGGKQTVKDWSKGRDNKPSPRFKADLFGNTIATVAPVSGTFKAEQTQLNCGDSTRLVWSSVETVESEIADDSETARGLPPSGDMWGRPKQTTTYKFRAVGPGGVTTSDAVVNVNPAVQAQFDASPPETRYRRIGDKVVQQGSSTLNWSTSNTDSIAVDPVGLVTATGTKAVQPVPQRTGYGTVDEIVTYTLLAKNQCGGSETRTATVHLTGSIEPVPEVPLASVFFPTGYPDQRHPETGLVYGQQQLLSRAASGFKAYLEYDPEARLRISGHADERDSTARNYALSERRAVRVKDYLVSAGIPADKIEVRALGKEQPLSIETVKALQQDHPETISLRNLQSTVWTYNRRVDIVLLPKGVASDQHFPANAPGAELLQNDARQERTAVLEAEEPGFEQRTTLLNRGPGPRP